MRKIKYFCLLLVLILFLTGCVNSYDNFVFGTFYNVSAKKLSKSKISELDSELNMIDNLLSTSIEGSDIYNINNSDRNIAVLCNSLTIDLLQKAKNYYTISEKNFNASIFPLVELWKFDPISFNPDISTVPSKEKIQETLAFCSLDNFIIDEQNLTVTKKIKEAKLDFGAFAKGYAVDYSYEYLKDCKDLMINIGGTIKTNSKKKIGINDPRNNSVFASFFLENSAVSTSGDYQRFYEIDSYRYHHILDSSGYPSTKDDIISVSVVGSDATLCDVLSTTVMCLGIEKSIDLLTSYGYSAIIITKDKYYTIGSIKFEVYNEKYTKGNI